MRATAMIARFRTEMTTQSTSATPVRFTFLSPRRAGDGDGASSLVDPRRTSSRGWIAVATTCGAIWFLMRLAFFVGVAGSDDLYYIRFAAQWDRPPITGWEARLLGNGLTALSMRALGRSELAATLPSLVASGVILASVLIWCRARGDLRAAWWAGLFTAVVPLDVEMGTTISPHTVMAAWMVVGTLAYLWPRRSTAARWVAAVCLSFGVVTHLAGVYYVAALAVAGLIVDRRRYAPLVTRTMIVGVVLLSADMAVFHFMFGDALCRFRACQAETTYVKPIMPLTADGALNPEYLMWPVRNLVFSKAFGVALPVVLISAWRRRRRMTAVERVGALAFCGFWLWMSFGSEVPWRYVPFDRITRFMHPALLIIATMFAAFMAAQPKAWIPKAVGAAVIGLSVLNLLGGGSWGQGAKVSKELLGYVRRHAERRFVTDYHTLNEMYALNGVALPPNLATTSDVPRSRLLDPSAPRLSQGDLIPGDALLLNPLNVARTPGFAALSEACAGPTLLETEPRYRRICLLVPPLRDLSWSLRSPSARVVAWSPTVVVRRFGERYSVEQVRVAEVVSGRGLPPGD